MTLLCIEDTYTLVITGSSTISILLYTPADFSSRPIPSICMMSGSGVAENASTLEPRYTTRAYSNIVTPPYGPESSKCPCCYAHVFTSPYTTGAHRMDMIIDMIPM
jgi:hypothetical protein